MILCIHCEYQVSPKAKACPNCGEPWPATGEHPFWKKLKQTNFSNLLLYLFVGSFGGALLGWITYGIPTGKDFFLDTSWAEKSQFMLQGDLILFVIFLLGGVGFLWETIFKSKTKLLIIFIPAYFGLMYLASNEVLSIISTFQETVPYQVVQPPVN